MIVLRPVRTQDLESIYDLSAHAGAGLTTLPHDKKILKQRVDHASVCFEHQVDKPGGETYLFVAEDLGHDKIIGTCAITSKVGGFEPYWTYEIKTMTAKSSSLKVKTEMQYLQLKADHNGPSEIGTLFLHPEYREGNNGRLLSLSRFLFMSKFNQCFEDTVIAEMRGVIDDEGRTVFWEALGKHFFQVDFEKADLMVMKDKSFIEDLMPKHPIYIPLLPKSARLVIGQVHENTIPAKRLLEQEGFAFNGEIDIFEAGPTLSAEVSQIRTIKQSQTLPLAKEAKVSKSPKIYLVSAGNHIADFRVVAAQVCLLKKGEVALEFDAIEALGVKSGDPITFSPIRPFTKH